MPVITRHQEESHENIFEATAVELQDLGDNGQAKNGNETIQGRLDFLRYGTSDDDMQF